MKKQVLRLVFIQGAVFLLAVMVSTVPSPEAAQYDILLKGGHVIDPANNINSIMDVAVEKGKIARVGRDIPDSDAEKVVDVSGYYVTPGLIDIHVHCFHNSPVKSYQISVIADHHHFSSGVTTVVDAGTSGADTFESFKEVIDRSKVRILAFLNIAAPGMGPAEMEPSEFNIKRAVETARKYPNTIIGFKTAHYFEIGTKRRFDAAHPPWASVDSVLAAARLAGLPVMYDAHPKPPEGGYPARSLRELILEKMRPGDIFTHMFYRGFPVVDKNGKVNPDLFKARERGVIFDIGHGQAAFAFKYAIPAIKQGFPPYSISTDLHVGNVNGPVLNIANVMSKFLNIGMTLEDIIRCSTTNPAKAINRPELGNLSAGSTADIAVLEVLTGDFGYTDCGRGKIKGDKKIQCALTLFGGKVVFDISGISYPLWQDIPKDDRYWQRPPQEW